MQFEFSDRGPRNFFELHDYSNYRRSDYMSSTVVTFAFSAAVLFLCNDGQTRVVQNVLYCLGEGVPWQKRVTCKNNFVTVGDKGGGVKNGQKVTKFA